MNRFVLSPDDPNYEAYADHEDDANIFYYVREADKLKAEELKTLYVDFSHLSSYNWEDPQFMDRLQGEYVRYEPYLRQGLTNFLSNQGHLICDQKWFQVGIYNLPGVQKIRDLKTFNLGKIMSISGTVTRTTEVKPELQIGSFRCVQCNQMNKGIEQ